MINTNASASAFGWEFQTNAAILLALRHIKKLIEIKVEGKIEDIEIYLEENKSIYIQAKSQVQPTLEKNNIKKLKEAMKTLVNATNKIKYNELIYISNLANPLKSKTPDYYWHSKDHIMYKFNDLSQEDKNSITDCLNSLEDMDISNFDLNKLTISTFPFVGEDKRTRYRVILSEIQNFLSKVDLQESLAHEFMDYLQITFFQNASMSIKMSKKEIIWPLVVIKSNAKDDNSFFEDYDDEEIEEIKRKFRVFINKQSEKFEFSTKVIQDYIDFKNNKASSKRGKISTKEFINECWTNYDLIISNDFVEAEINEAVIKLIMNQIITNRNAIDKVKEAAEIK